MVDDQLHQQEQDEADADVSLEAQLDAEDGDAGAYDDNNESVCHLTCRLGGCIKEHYGIFKPSCMQQCTAQKCTMEDEPCRP
jgi:hypothetical protein